jgi:thymidylate synthase
MEYKKGELPAIFVDATTLPEAVDRAILEVWAKGISVKTHYDKPGDPPSKEATVMIRVSNPLNEPRIYKNFPGGAKDLENYRLEVVHGIHNYWIEPGSTKWTYTYNERFADYQPSEDLNAKDRGILLSRKKVLEYAIQNQFANIKGSDIQKELIDGKFNIQPVNQIEKILDDLERDITSKGAQATTWMPTADPGLESNRPCLQRIWLRPFEAEIDGKPGYLLNMNVHFRSRDLYKAAYMNMFGLSDWQRVIAKKLEERIQKPVRTGSYVDISDSLHIYGSYFNKETKTKDEFEKSIERMKASSWENRAWATEDYDYKESLDSLTGAKHLIAAQIEWEKKTGSKGTVDPDMADADIMKVPYPKEWDE